MEKITQLPDIDELKKFIETLKIQGKVYNDVDFCIKTGIPKTYLSDIKRGRRPITENIVLKIQRAFPGFGGVESVSIDIDKDEPTLGEVARMVEDHDKRFHEQMERILDAMGVPKKEKIA